MFKLYPLLLAVLTWKVPAHFTFTDRSQIACDIGNTDSDTAINWLTHPIIKDPRFNDFDEWWMHGQAKCQAKAEGVFELKANDKVEVAMSSSLRKVPLKFSKTGKGWSPADPDKVFTKAEWGEGAESRGNTLDKNHNIHAYTRDDTSGCALGIAYKSDATQVRPKDFVIFSVKRDCPKRQREYFDVPALPTCPGGKCICAWFWIPKNSGLANYYFTPFVCNTVGDVGTSPVDYEYAIPPRRCLDPKLCNFGPRQPMYWITEGKEINMPEKYDLMQPPTFSTIYGFREGAQHDIFEATNPRRITPTSGFPAEQKCDGKPSRLTESKSSFTLTSPDCGCTAVLQSGNLKIRDVSKSKTIYQLAYTKFGPDELMNDLTTKTSEYYFPKSAAPYRIDLNNRCYLALTDNKGVVMWESQVYGHLRNEYVLGTFKGYDRDPVEWGAPTPSGGPVTVMPTPASEKPTPATEKPTPAPEPGNGNEVSGGYSNIHVNGAIPECRGDCDKDSDCAPELKCLQRDSGEDVPGCTVTEKYGPSGSGKDMDVCFNPNPSNVLKHAYHNDDRNIPACSGDCDNDKQCADGLKCAFRSKGEPVPGCSMNSKAKPGGEWQGVDFCYNPSAGRFISLELSAAARSTTFRVFGCSLAAVLFVLLA